MSKSTRKGRAVAATEAAPAAAVVGDVAAQQQEQAAVATAGEQQAAADGGDKATALYGSSSLPAVFDIGGQQVPLGDVVRKAFEATGLTVDEWNALQADDRDSLIADEAAAMTEEVARPEQAATPAPTFPRQVTLRNHSGFDVAEPATGALVGGGASVTVTVHDLEQATRLLQNVRTIKERTAGRQSLVVVGLGDDVSPEQPGDAQ